MGKKTLPIIIIAVLAVAVAVIVLLVYNSKSSKISRLEKFTAQVEQEYSNYSESDLEEAKAQFEKCVAAVEAEDLNGEERAKVNQLKGECKGYFVQARANQIIQNFENELNDAGDEVKGVIESMM